MADVQPLRALHYDATAARALDPVAAPPYDVIDAEQRAELVARVSAQRRRDRPPVGDDPYATRREVFEHWQCEGIVRDREPALWALDADYTAPGRDAPHAPRLLLRACGRPTTARARSARTSARTRPEGGPAAADARHAREPVADLLALRRPSGAAWGALAPPLEARRGARSPTRTAPSHRMARADPERDRARPGRAGRRRAADRRRPPPLRDRARVRARMGGAPATC